MSDFLRLCFGCGIVTACACVLAFCVLIAPTLRDYYRWRLRARGGAR